MIEECTRHGIDFTALSPVIPEMTSVISTKQRAKMARREIANIAGALRRGGGTWKGVQLRGSKGKMKEMGWPLRSWVWEWEKEDIHIVVVSHGSFMKQLLPCESEFRVTEWV